MTDKALSDIRIVDLTHAIAGPFCTKMLADFGAEVIKVEKTGVGDDARGMPPFLGGEPHADKSGLFLYLNTNKQSITLNLEDEFGVKVVKDLVKDADVVVENFRPGVMASLGLDYEVLAEINPKVIMCSISSFGQTGPYRDYKASSLISLALGGSLYQTGEKGRPPLVYGISLPEYMGGMQAFISVLAALHQRDCTGGGQCIDLSITESVASALEAAPIIYSYQGVIRGRGYSRFIYGHPVGIYPCKDGYIVVMPGLGGIAALALLLGHPEWEEHPLFVDPVARQQRGEEFDSTYLLPWLKEHNRQEIVELAQELRMPFGLVQTMDELLAEEQLQERGFFVKVDHPVAGVITYPGAPFKMSETPWEAGRAPILGEHNEEVYCERLGYTRKDLAELKERGAI